MRFLLFNQMVTVQERLREFLRGMAMEFIPLLMELFIKEIGRMIRYIPTCKKEKVSP